MEAEEIKSPFEAIKQTDEAGKEWWNSRQLAKVMGYTKYWNFERLMPCKWSGGWIVASTSVR